MIARLLFNVFYIEANCKELAASTLRRKQYFEGRRVEVANNTHKTRHGRKTFVKAILADPSLTSAQILAQKYANDALKSPKVQETIRKLSDIKLQQKPTTPQNLRFIADPIKNDVPKVQTKSRNYHKLVRHQQPRKKDRKSHKERRERFQSHRPRRSTQRKYDSTLNTKISKKRGFRKEVNQNTTEQRGYVLPPSIDDEKKIVQPSISEAENGNAVEDESMVQRLMKTTTRDPKRKSPGDQGIEYSEYYNDDDVLGEQPVNKIQLKPERTIKNPSVRFARHTANASSFYDYQLGNNYVRTRHPYLNEVVDKMDMGYDGSLGSVKAIQNYPEPVQDQNIQMSDNDSLGYLPNYELTEQRYSPADYSPIGNTESSISDSTRIPNENEDILIEPHARNFLAINRQNNVPQRTRVLDPMDTMQQPFGKVLASLGISINGTSRNNVHSLKDGSPTIPLNSQQSGNKIVGKPIEVILASDTPRRNSKKNFKKVRLENNGRRTNVQESEFDVENVRNGFSPEEIWMPTGSTDALVSLREQANRAKSQIPNGKSNRTKNVRSSLMAEDRANVTTTIKETKEVANQILNRIMDELEELKVDHTRNELKEGVPCKLTGSWVTSQAGVRIDMRIKNHSMAISLAAFTPEPAHSGLINATWNVTGNIPFKRGGPFSLFAADSYTKTLAVFVGACRVCQGIDTIEGVWSIAREPKDCRDFPVATRVVNDVFRRTKMLADTRQKLQTLMQGCTTLNSSSTTLSTSEITTTVPKKKSH